MNEWHCHCGGEQAEDGHCENDPWHIADHALEKMVQKAAAAAYAKWLGPTGNPEAFTKPEASP